MKTTLTTSSPSQLDTECLVVPVVDNAGDSTNGNKAKPNPQLLTDDQAVLDAAADLIASGEVAGKMLEQTLLHKPQGVSARRLLLIGGGKAKNFSSAELRKLAGAAVRSLKSKGVKSFVFVAPATWTGEADPASKSTYVYQRGGIGEAVKSIVEGAYIGNFDPNYYQSDREDKKIEELVIAAKPSSGEDDKIRQEIENALARSPESTLWSSRAEHPKSLSVSENDMDSYNNKTLGEWPMSEAASLVVPIDTGRHRERYQYYKLKPKADQKALEAAAEQGRIIGGSQNFARDLVNEPGNRMTPSILAERAKRMCDEVGLNCDIYDGDTIRELKMGAFWSVAQGSEEDPKLIIMRYDPAGAPEKPVLGLVGKGITFDSGGISIKPGEGMEKMKYDMAGGATMIGAMRAIAQLKPNVRVIGIVCASENMPSGKAQKPGDVQIAMSGKSIEIINTDAEGRLVLADGLHYAKQLGATHLIDAATLTGACVVALGMVNAGVFSNDEELWERFSRALQASGEKMWRLPVDDDYRDLIKSDIADIKNTGGRWGGAVTAAMFLKEFVGDTPWMHLDIAGVAWMEDNKPWIAKGPSGIAVRSLVEFAQQFAQDGSSSGASSGTSKERPVAGTDAAQKRSDSGAGL